MSSVRLIRPYRPQDLALLEVQPVQRHQMKPLLRDPVALAENGEAWSLLERTSDVNGDDREYVRAIGGLGYETPWRAKAWALIGLGLTGREWAMVSRKMGARLTLLQGFHGLRRVVAETPLEYGPGHGFLLHLGFRFEACLPGAGPDGEIYVQYGRYGERANLPPPYDAQRALAYRVLIDKTIYPTIPVRRAA